MVVTHKKLIEVALPLDAINKASLREKSIRRGHPNSMHHWWAPRPLASARAVIFSQMVDDPSSHPDLFPTEKAQNEERQRLFKIIEDLVLWENTNNDAVIKAATDEIWESWRRTCSANTDDPRSQELFNRDILPAFHDPFAGGGALPLEAQRLGMASHASDLNPVAVLINKAKLEIPSKFSGQPPVNPLSRRGLDSTGASWKGASGLANDVRYYGNRMKDEVRKRVEHLYPKIKITSDMTLGDPVLKQYLGQELDVVAWIWARTVKSPNPAFADVEVPLVGSFNLSRKKDKESWIDPITNIRDRSYKFVIRHEGKPRLKGTMTRSGGRCLFSDAAIPFEYIREQGRTGKMGQRLMAIVCESAGKKIYLPPNSHHESLLNKVIDLEMPSGKIPDQALGIRVQLYGYSEYADLLNRRQRLTMINFCEVIKNLGKEILKNDGASQEYSVAIQIYLALIMGRYADYGSTLTYWDDRSPSIQKTFGLPTLQMRWSYPEVNLFSGFSGNLDGFIEGCASAIELLPAKGIGDAYQDDAAQPTNVLQPVIVSTDPPYYDNIGYASLSDYFYIWLRFALKDVVGDLFSTVLTPKEAELIADPGRHKSLAADFYESRFTKFAEVLSDLTHPAYPITIYYAYKQIKGDESETNSIPTGWSRFLQGMISNNWQIQGTWPIRTEQVGGLRTVGRNALASSIVLVCRKRDSRISMATRRELIEILKSELPEAINVLKLSNIAPVDLQQAAIGPGISIFSRYSSVIDADGKSLSVSQALRMINEIAQEALSDQEGDFDRDTQFAISWFEQEGFDEGQFGVAQVLERAKDTSIEAMFAGGILEKGRGKVRLFKPAELEENWDPREDDKLIVWKSLHQLIRAHQIGGDDAAARLVALLGSNAEDARTLAYRLYDISNNKRNNAEDSLRYNAIVQSWPDIVNRASKFSVSQQGMLI